MKIISSLIFTIFISTLFMAFTTEPTPQADAAKAADSFHSFSINSLEGENINMADFEGKYVLIVNVASKCGYTPQYAPLQELYNQHSDKLVVIGFPCNQFGGQEPGTAEDIASFCERNYGVSFPMTEKIDVKGKNQHPIYSWLTQEAENGVSDANVNWNFNKFLISPEGAWLAHFSSGTDPLGDEIMEYVK